MKFDIVETKLFSNEIKICPQNMRYVDEITEFFFFLFKLRCCFLRQTASRSMWYEFENGQTFLLATPLNNGNQLSESVHYNHTQRSTERETFHYMFLHVRESLLITMSYEKWEYKYCGMIETIQFSGVRLKIKTSFSQLSSNVCSQIAVRLLIVIQITATVCTIRRGLSIHRHNIHRWL